MSVQIHQVIKLVSIYTGIAFVYVYRSIKSTAD